MTVDTAVRRIADSNGVKGLRDFRPPTAHWAGEQR
ncbi:hypothetical protein P3T27_000612 [Kitasatospora sp. MAA19]|nr:hypothetical protein [Kitasatospora sp. MAA19]